MIETVKHAAMPRLCAECEIELRAMLQDGQEPSGVHCIHNNVLAMFEFDGMTIKRWRLVGPVTEAQAERIIRIRNALDLGVESALTHPAGAH